MTAPPNYWPMRRRLLRRGVKRVDIAPIWPPDWALAGMLGFGNLLRRTGRAIARTYHAADGRPIIVIAHSGGGIVTRLAMSDVAYYGRVAAVAEAVGCLTTLGTPHMMADLPNRYRHAGHEACSFLDRETPGAFFAPRTAYLTVGSSFRDAPFKGIVGRLADEVFGMVVGRDPRRLGDGIVPAGVVHLSGAEQLTFDDVRHGHIGAPWYGDDAVMDRWWPVAVRLWREALEARARGLQPVCPRDPNLARAVEAGAEQAAHASAQASHSGVERATQGEAAKPG
jgi:hypothetical protein